MLMSKLMGQSLCLMQVYESKPSAIKAYPQLAKEISDALRVLSLADPRSFWETPMHTLGIMLE